MKPIAPESKHSSRAGPVLAVKNGRTTSCFLRKCATRWESIALAIKAEFPTILTAFLGILSSKIHVVWALATGGWLGVGNDPVYVKTKCFDPFPKTLKEQLSAIRDLFRTQSGEWTAAQVIAHFKGANRKQKVILECLESWEDLGILLSHAENGMTFWHLAEVEKAR